VEQLRKKGIVAFKVLISGLLFYFIFTKVPFNAVLKAIRNAHLGYLFLAVLFFVISKVLSALRLNCYFHQLGILLTQLSNFKLYLLGMFYNLFLPGGIGGDAYKGYLIKKTFDIPTKKVVAVLFLDRLSGLLLLFLYGCALAIYLDNPVLRPYLILFKIAMPVAVVVFWMVNKRFFAYAFPVFKITLGYAALVQLAQLIAVFFILCGLGIADNIAAYLFIFLISSIVTIIPLTPGGAGARELVFFYGALWFGLEESGSLSVSLLFFAITALVSLSGIMYHFKKPQLNTQKNEA